MKITKVIKYGLVAYAIHELTSALLTPPARKADASRRQAAKKPNRSRGAMPPEPHSRHNGLALTGKHGRGRDSVAHDSSGGVSHHKVGRGVVHHG